MSSKLNSLKNNFKDKIIFISGIDTDVGKTVVTGMLARDLNKLGVKTISQKMVQTGAVNSLSEDILIHRKIQNIELLDEDLNGQTCNFLFKHPCSPHLAAKLEQRTIDPRRIESATQKLFTKYSCVLLEGAGGLTVPITTNFSTLDYIKQHNYPLILVSNAKLGSLNHTILSLMACKQYNINLQALIYNCYPTSDPLILADSLDYLQKYLASHHPNSDFLTLENLNEAILI